MTNDEKLVNMTTRERAEFIARDNCCECCIYHKEHCTAPDFTSCEDGIEEWLKQEVEIKEVKDNG